MSDDVVLTGDAITGHGRSLNPFLLLDDATGFLAFATEVFGATENEDMRTPTPDGRLIHAELNLGASLLMLADALDGWPRRPGLLQVWVADVNLVLERGRSSGASVVTPPTPFYGELTLARMQDPWGNLWWLYQPSPGQEDPKPSWEGGSDVVFRTLDEHLKGVAAE
jgi:PhnB protein